MKVGKGATHVMLRGELDLATVGIAEDAIAKADGKQEALVLDLRNLTFLDSSGLRLILVTAEGTEGTPKKAFIVRGPSQVDRVFELTGVADRLNMIDEPSQIDKG